ncbi:hypothetical protein [Silvibacterium sp.]|uniref:hypothetical protein n=1 Tax=Silvibacterium sp. TaxID=1964179 RepID=UPI0039E233B4
MWLMFAACCLAPGSPEGVLPAQVIRVQTPRPKPNVTVGDTLTVSATPASVSFQLTPGSPAQASSVVSVTTTWTGISLLSSITLSAYFASATQALTGGSPVSSIPSSVVLGKVPSGLPTSFTPFTQTAPLGPVGSGLLLYSQTSVLSLGGSRTDALSLEIDLTTLPQLPAATYTGVLVLQAQAF